MVSRRKNKPAKRVCVVDSETDPFKYGRPPKPFSWGFYDGQIYKDYWTSDLLDATVALLDYLASIDEPLIIYAHNGGKFDFFFFMEHGAIENPALIISGRITKAALLGIHEIRDSYSIMPIPLKQMTDTTIGGKLDIEYWKLEKEHRENHKEEILKYQKQDCVVLYGYVMKFRERYGDKLTVGAMAITELEKYHKVSRQNAEHDSKFRPYYFGGRVECFMDRGVRGGKKIAPNGNKWKIYDVNSMYPDAMKSYDHPYGANYVTVSDPFKRFNKRTGDIQGFVGPYFMVFVGNNRGAIPKRLENGGLDFNIPYGEFHACSHEIKVACELGLIDVHEIKSVWIPHEFLRFDKFVEITIQEKIEGKKNGDKAQETFAKLKMNSPYGKMASNAGDFKEWFIYDSEGGEDAFYEFEEWRSRFVQIKGGKSSQVVTNDAEMVHDYGRFEIWQAPNPSDRGFFDVAVAASITSAARSILLRAIHHAERALYCDTDSLVCLSLKHVELDDYKLGAWKFEGSCDAIYIAGKKMYSAMLDQLDKQGKPQNKIASKGAKLVHQDIVDMCDGKIVYWQSDAPNFKFSGETKFVARRVRKNI